MKAFKKIVLHALFFTLKTIRLIKKPDSACIFLAPDIPISNLGDQALLLGSLQSMSDAKLGRIFVVANGPERIAEVPNIEQFSESVDIIQSLHVMFATQRAFPETLKFYWLTRKVRSIVLVGADVLDGRYNPEEAARKLAIIRQCIALGLRAKIVGFSLSTSISEQSKQGFIELSGSAKFIARDPLSQQRMQVFAPCELGADCAFMMNPFDMSPTEQPKLDQFLKGSSSIVGVCLRTEDFPENKSHTDLQSFADGLIAALSEANSSLMLIPHHPSDIDMLKDLANILEQKGFDAFLWIDTLPSAQNIKALVNHCEHIITSRMHVAIASLGMQKAITCIPYAGKFEGLFQHFELKDAAIDRERLGDAAYIHSFLKARFAKSDDISKHVSEKLETIKALSRSNFEGL